MALLVSPDYPVSSKGVSDLLWKKMELEAEVNRLRTALKFYAYGDWNDHYPGGVNCKNGDLDMGEEAQVALEGTDLCVD